MAQKTSATVDSDELLKQMVSQAVQQSENLRETVRDLTLQALKTRELNPNQIKAVLKAVTAGVNLGAAKPAVDAGKAISDALAGMDEALLQAVQASHLALQQFSSQGRAINQAHIKKALDDLERLEEQFFNTVQQACEGTTGKLREQWLELLKHARLGGTDAGALAARSIEDIRNRMTAALREPGAATLNAAQAFYQNFATLASGILIGLSDAIQEKGQKKTES